MEVWSVRERFFHLCGFHDARTGRRRIVLEWPAAGASSRKLAEGKIIATITPEQRNVSEGVFRFCAGAGTNTTIHHESDDRFVP